MIHSFDLERAQKIIRVLDGLAYSDAIRLLTDVTFLVDERSRQEYVVSTNNGMSKLLSDYDERRKADVVAEANSV